MTGYTPLFSPDMYVNTRAKIGDVGIFNATTGHLEPFGHAKSNLPNQIVITSTERVVRELAYDPPIDLRGRRSMWFHGYSIVVGTVHVRAPVDYGTWQVPESIDCTNLAQIKVLRVRRSWLGKYWFDQTGPSDLRSI